MILLLAVVIALVIGYSVGNRIIKNRKPSVTSREHYRQLAIRPLILKGSFIYEDPSNYTRKDGKLEATSAELILQEKRVNSVFRDKIPWCMPPKYGNLEMNGAFPSIQTCGLEDICNKMRRNINVFAEEFNANKEKFMHNPELIGYGGHYGRIELNNVDEFPETNRILRSEPRYNVSQTFNERAGHIIMGTVFTVLYPGASIRPHFGPTNYKYRIHLCLDIDGEGGIVTAYGTRMWEVGKIFILDDSYLHAGFYEGTRPRVILMVDIAKNGLTFEDIDELTRYDQEDKDIGEKLKLSNNCPSDPIQSQH